MSTKNLGQIAGIYIGSVPPSNIRLIWYDVTPSILCHKIYDIRLKSWKILDKNHISVITYSELKNIAKNIGISQGSWYQISDRGNVLALAITTTKIQYVDINDNFIIDDLAGSSIYAVNSSNLIIDDISGVFNEETKKIEFKFNEEKDVSDIENIYILGKKKRGNIWNFIKYKINLLISSDKSNDVKWKSGIFFSFNNKIKELYDVEGGLTSFSLYNKDKIALQGNLNNVLREIKETLNLSKKYTDNSVSDENIFSKKLNVDLSKNTIFTDIKKGDSLVNILNKIQSCINLLKHATGIRISKNFSLPILPSKVNNNDTVESAIAKLQKQFDGISFKLPKNWKSYKSANVGIKPEDEIITAIAKIEADRIERNEIETDWTSTTINTSSNSTEIVKYRIKNGMLDIVIPNSFNAQWFYTRNLINDEVRNDFTINLPKSFVNKIIKFFPKIEDGFFNKQNVLFLSTIGQTALTEIQDVDTNWNNPKYLVSASINFSLLRKYDNGEENYAFSITLLPMYIVENNKETGMQILSCKGQKFQDILQNYSAKFYIPATMIHYKLW